MARTLHTAIAWVDKKARTLAVDGYFNDYSDFPGWPNVRPSGAARTLLHTESLSGRVDPGDWTRRLDAAGFQLDNDDWREQDGRWELILAEHQPAVS